MSGMYIRGEVPDSCRNCPIVNKTKSGLRCPIASRRKGFSCTVSFGIVGRPSYCPIVPVPDHGRTIDADAFKKRMMQGAIDAREDALTDEIWRRVLDAAKNLCLDVDEQPTIIPSDYQEEVWV